MTEAEAKKTVERIKGILFQIGDTSDLNEVTEMTDTGRIKSQILNGKEIEYLAALYRDAERELDNITEKYNYEKDMYERDSSRYVIKMKKADQEAATIARLMEISIEEVIERTFDY